MAPNRRAIYLVFQGISPHRAVNCVFVVPLCALQWGGENPGRRPRLLDIRLEWWHYTFKPETYPETYFDLPVAASSLTD